MKPYALKIRAGVGRPRAGGGLAVCTQGSTACQEPTQTHCQAGYKGILARILRGPLREGDAGFIRQTMPAPQWSLCAGFSLRTEGRNHLCLPLPAGRISGHRSSHPARTSGVQRDPGLTAEGRKGSWLGRGILFSLSVGDPQPSVAGVAGKARGTGAGTGGGGR